MENALLTDEQLKWFGSGHERLSGFGLSCKKCHLPYPCITIRIIEELRHLRVKNRELILRLKPTSDCWRE